MQRNEIIYALVLDEFSDDYEEIDYVVEQINKSGSVPEPAATRQEVETVVRSLIQSGDINAYILRSFPPFVEMVTGVPDELDDYWFYQTEKGKALNASIAWPPGGFE